MFPRIFNSESEEKISMDPRNVHFDVNPDRNPLFKDQAKGFTLTEVLITLVIASILGAVVMRFYKDSYRTYSLQEQIADRNQNAHYTLSKLVEVLQSAGSDLPDAGWTVITVTGSTLTLGLNPRGADQFSETDPASSNFIAVNDASKFKDSNNVLLNTTHILVDYVNLATATAKAPIDLAYNSSGFIKGIKDNATGLDSIRITTPFDLSVGDKIYGYREDVYALSSNNLVIQPNGSTTNQMVLAENIDSIGYTFFDKAGTVTTTWANMSSVSITVRGRTEKSDPKYPGDGYRKITLTMNVRLRNKT